MPLWSLYVAPHDLLAVLAVFGHIGCAISWAMAARSTRFQSAIIAGALIAGAIVGGFIIVSRAGGFYDVDVPQAYTRMLVR